MSFSESLVARPRRRINNPVALGSSVPQCPTFLISKFRRMFSTTSWEVGPAGLSMSSAPSSVSKVCMSGKGAFDFVDDLALDTMGGALYASARGSGMAAAAKFLGDVVDVHFLALGAQADPRQ